MDTNLFSASPMDKVTLSVFRIYVISAVKKKGQTVKKNGLP